jgi:hypothetical protein
LTRFHRHLAFAAQVHGERSASAGGTEWTHSERMLTRSTKPCKFAIMEALCFLRCFRVRQR